MGKLQPGNMTAEDLIKRHGVALRWQRTDPDDPASGAWVAAFHFAGPDVVQQGGTIEKALINFQTAVWALQEALPAEAES